MKSLITLVMFILSFSAMASNPKVFIGKYSVGECPIYNLYGDDYSRAYITIEENSVVLNMYGYDALIEEFYMGSSVRQAPGTDREMHGEVSQKTEVKWITKSDVEVTTYTKRPSIGFEGTDYFRLSLKNKKLVITASWTTSELGTCTLTKIK